MNKKSLCKRVPAKQAIVLDFIAEKEEEPFTSILKRALNASPVFVEFKKEYELSVNDG